MAVHFDEAEFAARMDRLQAAMAERRLDAMLLFAQESMYWLTGYDTSGFSFFQCLVVTKERRLALVARAADLRQARQTTMVDEIIVWSDRPGADSAKALKDHLFEMDLLGCRIGIEYDTPGLNGRSARQLDEQMRAFATTEDASELIPRLRTVKSAAEIDCVRRAAALADEAWRAGLAIIRPGADGGTLIAAMQAAVLSGGGDYPANEFVVGSGREALLIRPHSGRRVVEPNDQVTLSFAGVWHRYHVAMMETVVVGEPHPRHAAMYEACADAVASAAATMQPGNTFGEVYDVTARVLSDHGMGALKLGSCGYSLGAAFAPTWIDWPMINHANPVEIVPNMVLFLHATLFDLESATAMSLGRSFLTTDGAPEPLSAIPPAFLTR